VPCVIYDPGYRGEYPAGNGDAAPGDAGSLNEGLGISSIAATCIKLLGYLPPADYDRAVIK
jgi:2,3-bisphosphoglycerate-independent phosphoglycerate mutase